MKNLKTVMISLLAAVNAWGAPDVNVTYIGTATLLIEIGNKEPFRILTDPVFDLPGATYPLGIGYKTTKLIGPAVQAKDLPKIDLVLLSHDAHADNLDHEGRKLLPRARKILTTQSGEKRLKADRELGLLPDQISGLRNWQSWRFTSKEGLEIKVTAVPGQHSPSPLLTWLSGEVIGFVLEWTGQKNGITYITGDTVYIPALREVANGKRFRDPEHPEQPAKIENLFLHLAAVQFSATFKKLWTMDGREGARLINELRPKRVIPLHFDGWSHFGEDWEHSQTLIEPVISHLKATQDITLERLKPGVRTPL